MELYEIFLLFFDIDGPQGLAEIAYQCRQPQDDVACSLMNPYFRGPGCRAVGGRLSCLAPDCRKRLACSRTEQGCRRICTYIIYPQNKNLVISIMSVLSTSISRASAPLSCISLEAIHRSCYIALPCSFPKGFVLPGAGRCAPARTSCASSVPSPAVANAPKVRQ